MLFLGLSGLDRCPCLSQGKAARGCGWKAQRPGQRVVSGTMVETEQDAGDYKHQLWEGNLGCRSDAGRKVGQLKQMPCLEIIITEHKRGVRLVISRQRFPAASGASGWGLAAVGIRRQESWVPPAKPHQAPLLPSLAACKAVPLQGSGGLLCGQAKS